jgi:hypothetical protein
VASSLRSSSLRKPEDGFADFQQRQVAPGFLGDSAEVKKER